MFLLESCSLIKWNHLQLCVLQGLLVMAGGIFKIVDSGKKVLIIDVDVVGFLMCIFCLLGLEAWRLKAFLLRGMINCDCWRMPHCFLDFS